MSDPSHLSDEQIAEFKEAFSVFDKKGDGIVTTKELETVMKSLGLNPSESELKSMLKDVDDDGNGTLDFVDFVAQMSKKMKDVESPAEILDAFKMFDKSGNGKISIEDLKNVMTKLGAGMSDDEVEEILKDANPDGEGNVNYSEFVKVIMGN